VPAVRRIYPLLLGVVPDATEFIALLILFWLFIAVGLTAIVPVIPHPLH
jgi:hypothetical protein